MSTGPIRESASDQSDLGHNLGAFLIDGVQEIDRRCCKIIDGVECGLAYVREQFREDGLRDTGKKLTEELLISWLLRDRLRAAGVTASLEQPYPNWPRQKCDLVTEVEDNAPVAIEVKAAWKKWIRCDGSVHTSSAFKGYLLGDASHPGTAHDFDKLEGGGWPAQTWLGVLLVGFDTFRAPMDDMILELQTRKDLERRGWALAAHRGWPDRKNEEFRIVCWFWARPPIRALQ